MCSENQRPVHLSKSRWGYFCQPSTLCLSICLSVSFYRKLTKHNALSHTRRTRKATTMIQRHSAHLCEDKPLTGPCPPSLQSAPPPGRRQRSWPPGRPWGTWRGFWGPTTAPSLVRDLLLASSYSLFAHWKKSGKKREHFDGKVRECDTLSESVTQMWFKMVHMSSDHVLIIIFSHSGFIYTIPKWVIVAKV